jgi:uncharacterized membrane protein
MNRGNREEIRRDLIFLGWLFIALLGAMGLVVFPFGLLFQGDIIRMAGALQGAEFGHLAMPASTWWTGISLSALAITIGVVGLAREQRIARSSHRETASRAEDKRQRRAA